MGVQPCNEICYASCALVSGLLNEQRLEFGQNCLSSMQLAHRRLRFGSGMQPLKGKVSARAHFGRDWIGKPPRLTVLLSVAWLSVNALAAMPLAAAPEQTEPPPTQAPAALASAEVSKVPVGYLKQKVKRPIPLSRLHVEPEDYGIAGAELALEDNNTTGRFTKQEFTLDVERVPVGGDAIAALQKLVDSGHHFILVDAPAETLLALSDQVKGKDVLLFNVRAEDEELRQEECRANILHTAPDRYMLADALAQYLVWKKWQRWFVVKGVFPEDLAYLEAIRRSAKRFGGTIVEEREYKEAPGARRSDTGEQQIQQQMPVFTQSAPSYDVLVVADEKEVFGPYLPFRTWDPRPVAGTAGLVARSGTQRMSNGVPRKCRTGSSASPIGSCGRWTIRLGLRSAPSARERRGRAAPTSPRSTR